MSCLAWMDLAAGRFTVMQLADSSALHAELARLRPAEILVPDGMSDSSANSAESSAIRPRPAWHYELGSATRVLCEQFGTRDLSGFGCAEKELAISAAGALLLYVRDTQKTALPHLQSLNTEDRDAALIMDPATRRNLEIDTSLAGYPDLTLAGVVDQTSTAMGGRLLRRWLHRPLRDHARIRARHFAVAALIHHSRHANMPTLLQGVGDMERVLSRVGLRSARPRDLAQLRSALGNLPGLREALRNADDPLLQELTYRISDHGPERELLQRAVIDNPPHYVRDGGVIKEAFDSELDELRLLGSDTEVFLLELERKEKERTGLSSLKLGFNRVQGFFIEVSRGQADQVPAEYVRRQTVKSAERFITPQLKSFEDRVLGARERALSREKALYDELLETLSASLASLQATASAIAELDVLCNFAERAISLEWTQPEFVAEPVLTIEGGRHPVVERANKEPFVPNDLRLDESKHMLIITGPNMGGKSTFMRQAALVTLLAHAGSFVPAQRAILGPIDRIFTRIGASDDLAGGRSTFMLEMTETANILNNATHQSLVLMDEIGRGTSTFDGLSLAWACAAYMAKSVKALTLFATHYFELTSLATEIQGVANAHVEAVEHGESLILLHRVKDGPASQSYGLKVAALAGIPKSVTTQAKRYLWELERERDALRSFSSPQTELPLVVVSAPRERDSAALQLLREADPDTLSPRQALDLIFQLRALDAEQTHRDT